MILHIEQYHISHGEKGVCGSCPVALKIREHNPKLYVGAETLFYQRQNNFPFGEQHIAMLPENVKEWIVNFDTHCKVTPFSFHISAECFMR